MPKGKGYGKKPKSTRRKAKTPAPSSMLGSGLMGKAAKSMRERRRRLKDI